MHLCYYVFLSDESLSHDFKMEIDKLKYQQCINLVNMCAVFTHCLVLDGRTSILILIPYLCIVQVIFSLVMYCVF